MGINGDFWRVGCCVAVRCCEGRAAGDGDKASGWCNFAGFAGLRVVLWPNAVAGGTRACYSLLVPSSGSASLKNRRTQMSSKDPAAPSFKQKAARELKNIFGSLRIWLFSSARSQPIRWCCCEV